MKCRALVVPRRDGERVRRVLAESERLRTDLAIFADLAEVAIPLRDGAEVAPPPGGRVEVREFEPIPAAGPSDYRALLSGSAEDRARLPRSFDVIGDVVLIRIPAEWEARRAEIGAALLAFVPGARAVGADRGVHGDARTRTVERIAGGGGFATRHRENGIEFDVDPTVAYFSPRLAREHAEVAESVATGDRVLDLCCGVGPFSATIARDGRARSVTAVDANSAAIGLLRGTLARYPWGPRVTPLVARIEEFLPSAGPVERAVLNLPHEGIKYLPQVAPVVRPSGHIHYYEVTPRAEVRERTEAIVNALGSSGSWRVAESHVVHPFSPSADLRAFDLEHRSE